MSENFKEKKMIVTVIVGLIGSTPTDSLLGKGVEMVGMGNLFNRRLETLDEDFKHNKL